MARWMTSTLRSLRPFDWLAAAVAAALIVLFTITVERAGGDEAVVYIESAQGDFIYPLAEDQNIEVSGPIGVTQVQIGDGRVRVATSPCNDKICIIAGWLAHASEWAACLPNRVFVHVVGGAPPQVDAQTY